MKNIRSNIIAAGILCLSLGMTSCTKGFLDVEKKNRDKIMKREKRERIIAEVIVCVVVVALIAWAGYSFYQNHKPTVVNTYSVDSTALDDYMSEMNAETEPAETENGTEAAESEDRKSTR